LLRKQLKTLGVYFFAAHCTCPLCALADQKQQKITNFGILDMSRNH